MAFRDLAKHPFASGLGLLFGLMTGIGILLAAAFDMDVLGAALVVGGFVGVFVSALIAARTRKPGEPL